MSNLEELNYAIISELRDQLEAKEQMIKEILSVILDCEKYIGDVPVDDKSQYMKIAINILRRIGNLKYIHEEIISEIENDKR